MSEKELDPIAVLYEDHAPIYAAIAQDRDFGSEARALLRSLTRASADGPLRAVDLFAGPARHAIAFQNFGLTAYALDSSPAMATIAITNGLATGRYVVGSLPEAVAELPDSLDLAVAMRYSLGYLDDDDVLSLLSRLRNRMRTGSSLFLELHRLDLVAGGFAMLSIRTRRFLLPDGGEAECIWPDGGLRWNREAWVVEMGVTVRVIGNSDGRVLRFRSRERIHTIADLRLAASSAGGWSFSPRDAHLDGEFPQSEIVRLEAV